MKRTLLLSIILAGLFGFGYGQRVQGTIKAGTNPNEVIVAIKPTLAFTATMSNLIVSVQIPTSVGPRPTVTYSNLQSSLFATWDQVNVDQGDGFYTWGFNCAVPGGGNTASTLWPATEMDVLKISFLGATVPPFTARICHYLDGGIGQYAIFYVETNLAAVNGGVLSNWGNLFYGTGATNGATAAGNIGVPNAQYSYSTVPNIVLPVKFVGFNVTKKNNDAMLTWQIENESTLTDYFEIERSLNGTDFAKLTSIKAKNNGSASNSYDITDLNLTSVRSSGIIYYRIKQVDKDGHFIYSGIRNVRLNAKGMIVNVYPNPIRDFANLSIDLEQDANTIITINDATGKQVQNIQMQLFKGTNTKKISMANLSAGSYMLKVQTTSELKTISVVKAN